MNFQKKNWNHFAEKKNHSVFEGFKGGSFKHSKTFFWGIFFYFYLIFLYLWKLEDTAR